MNLKFLYNLFHERKALSPDDRFRAVLWGKLSEHWQDTYALNYRWYQTFVFRMAVSSFVIVLVLSGFATSAYAYTSPEVTAGTILYPLKQSLENIEGVTKTTSEAKAKFYLKKIERREAEKVVLERRQQKVGDTEEKIKIAEQKLGEVNEVLETDSDKLKDKIKTRLNKRQELLQEKIDQLGMEEKLLEEDGDDTEQDNELVKTNRGNNQQKNIEGASKKGREDFGSK